MHDVIVSLGGGGTSRELYDSWFQGIVTQMPENKCRSIRNTIKHLQDNTQNIKRLYQQRSLEQTLQQMW